MERPTSIRTLSPVLLAQWSSHQEAVWRVALESQGFATTTAASGDPARRLPASPAGHTPPCALVIADLAYLGSARTRADEFCGAGAAAASGPPVILTAGRRLEVGDAERRWARAQGALDLLPAVSMARQGAAAAVGAVCAQLGRAELDAARLESGLRALAAEVATVEDDIVARLAQTGIDAAGIAARMRGDAGVARAERRYRLTWYPNCFVGAEAVDWLVQGYGLAREQAVSLGQHLLAHGAIHHVVKEQPFLDGFYFYRFADARGPIDRLEIDAVVARLRGRGGLTIGERQYLGRRHAACFTGRAAVDWMSAAFDLAREDAVGLGQRLVDLGLVHHVVDEHEFAEAEFLYRFYADEEVR